MESEDDEEESDDEEDSEDEDDSEDEEEEDDAESKKSESPSGKEIRCITPTDTEDEEEGMITSVSDLLWTPCGPLMDSLWTPYGLLMDPLLTYYSHLSLFILCFDARCRTK